MPMKSECRIGEAIFFHIYFTRNTTELKDRQFPIIPQNSAEISRKMSWGLKNGPENYGIT